MKPCARTSVLKHHSHHVVHLLRRTTLPGCYYNLRNVFNAWNSTTANHGSFNVVAPRRETEITSQYCR